MFRLTHMPTADHLDAVLDSFAGGGGASSGIEQGLNRAVDVAINHDLTAVNCHAHNHPDTQHYCKSVYNVSPHEAVGGRKLGLAWFSPDCKHFSRAKGGKPVDAEIRDLAWIVIDYANLPDDKKPDTIILENVPEFVTWGDVDQYGNRIHEKAGQTFMKWLDALTDAGYKYEYRVLNAADYGAATTRSRFFLIARCDNKPIVWPKATHARQDNAKARGLKPWVSAAEVIDFGIKCDSIFKPGRDLCESTLQRIFNGINKHIINADNPFILNDHAYCISAIGHSGWMTDRSRSMTDPIHTIVTKQEHILIKAKLAIDLPYKADDKVAAFMIKYYGNDKYGASIKDPVHTITTKERHALGLVRLSSDMRYIVDISMRMLSPLELAKAQGFPDDYYWPLRSNGSIHGKETVRLIGNSVPPPLAKALVEANCMHLALNAALAA